MCRSQMILRMNERPIPAGSASLQFPATGNTRGMDATLQGILRILKCGAHRGRRIRGIFRSRGPRPRIRPESGEEISRRMFRALFQSHFHGSELRTTRAQHLLLHMKRGIFLQAPRFYIPARALRIHTRFPKWGPQRFFPCGRMTRTGSARPPRRRLSRRQVFLIRFRSTRVATTIFWTLPMAPFLLFRTCMDRARGGARLCFI